MKLKLVTILLLLFAVKFSNAQENPNEYQEEKPILLRNELSFGIMAHTNGFGVEMKRAFVQTYNRKWFIESQLANLKHPKEIRTFNQSYSNPKSYVFGKLNSFMTLRVGAGRQHILNAKAERTGVEVRLNYAGGLSLGLAKPIYLVVNTSSNAAVPPDPDSIITEQSNDTSSYMLNPGNIIGRAQFYKGLDQIKPYPGLFVKAALNFEYSPYHEDIKSLEVGVCLDAFPKKIPIMALTNNRQFFLSFYITIIYGRKW